MVNQTPIKAPDFIYMFSDSKHHTPATLVIAAHCLQYPIMQDTPGVPGPSCDQSRVKAVKLIQKDNSKDNREQAPFSPVVSSCSKYFQKTTTHSEINPRYRESSYSIYCLP